MFFRSLVVWTELSIHVLHQNVTFCAVYGEQNVSLQWKAQQDHEVYSVFCQQHDRGYDISEV